MMNKQEREDWISFLCGEIARTRFRMYCGKNKISNTSKRIYGVKWGKPWHYERLERRELRLLAKLETMRNGMAQS